MSYSPSLPISPSLSLLPPPSPYFPLPLPTSPSLPHLPSDQRTTRELLSLPPYFPLTLPTSPSLSLTCHRTSGQPVSYSPSLPISPSLSLLPPSLFLTCHRTNGPPVSYSPSLPISPSLPTSPSLSLTCHRTSGQSVSYFPSRVFLARPSSRCRLRPDRLSIASCFPPGGSDDN